MGPELDNSSSIDEIVRIAKLVIRMPRSCGGKPTGTRTSPRFSDVQVTAKRVHTRLRGDKADWAKPPGYRHRRLRDHYSLQRLGQFYAGSLSVHDQPRKNDAGIRPTGPGGGIGIRWRSDSIGSLDIKDVLHEWRPKGSIW